MQHYIAAVHSSHKGTVWIEWKLRKVAVRVEEVVSGKHVHITIKSALENKPHPWVAW